jgi:hypothetical protein
MTRKCEIRDIDMTDSSGFTDPNKIYLSNHGIPSGTNREVINTCIDKRNALRLLSKPNSIGIRIRYNPASRKLTKAKLLATDLISGTDLIPNYFGISSDSVRQLLSNTEINSLIFYICDTDVLIIEKSKDRCSEDETGGEGLKVKIPGPPAP